MTLNPKNYDEWLALSEDERNEVHFKIWDTYARDGIVIPFIAASRLALTCGRKVLNISVGTYHGGEYLLHLVVSPEDYKNCPPMLQETFEGFRVVWMPSEEFQAIDESGATLEGSWVSNDGYYEFTFARNASGLSVDGKVNGTNTEFGIQDPVLNDRFVLFSAYDPSRDDWSQHAFRLVAPDLADDNSTVRRSFRRKV